VRRLAFVAIVAFLAAGCSSDPGGGDTTTDGAAPDAGVDVDATGDLDAALPTPGFRAEYFARYRTSVVTAVEAQIDHAWGNAEPAAGAGADRFSARFTATLDVPAAGTYRFATRADDGVRLWVGDALVIDNWIPHFVERHEGTVELAAGPVAIRLDYFEIDLAAELHLYWTPPGGTETLLDATHVTTAPGTDAGPKPPYTNPLVPTNCPDPGVISIAGAGGAPPTYYAVCTGGSFRIRRSYDLVLWEDTGASILPAGKPPWAANGGRNWAPEIHTIGDRYVAYYTSVNGANVLSIGAASADAPTGPYTDRGSPLVEHPDGVIDATLARDAAGVPYLVYKIDGNAHGRPTPILIRRLAADGLSFAPGSTETELLRNAPGTWEGGVVEAPWIVERGGTYFLFYSGNVYDHRYRTGVARATSITGPYTKLGDPILGNDADWVGPGHGSVVPVGDRLYFTYHAWRENGAGQHDSTGGRVILLDEIDFVGGWPRIHDGTPSAGLEPWPGE
jgi:hypothetical protein